MGFSPLADQRGFFPLAWLGQSTSKFLFQIIFLLAPAQWLFCTNFPWSVNVNGCEKYYFSGCWSVDFLWMLVGRLSLDVGWSTFSGCWLVDFLWMLVDFLWMLVGRLSLDVGWSTFSGCWLVDFLWMLVGRLSLDVGWSTFSGCWLVDVGISAQDYVTNIPSIKYAHPISIQNRTLCGNKQTNTELTITASYRAAWLLMSPISQA